MKLKYLIQILCCLAASAQGCAFAYEVNNHAAISEEAIKRSILNTDTGTTGKLFRLGLKDIPIQDDPRQTFPRVPNSVLDPTLKALCWQGDRPGVVNAPADGAALTLVQLMQLGACFEDSTDNGYRVFAHFFDVQHGGQGLSAGPLSGPPSPAWTLDGVSGGFLKFRTGDNDFTWRQARIAFYNALTTAGPRGEAPALTAERRALYWGKTFQSLGHIVHHIQDMAQPQHVRNDDHCDQLACIPGVLLNPSGYEYWARSAEDRLNTAAVVRALAASAPPAFSFATPGEFWIGANYGGGYAATDQGMAAYASTNYVTSGTDYVTIPEFNARAYIPANNPSFPLPVPTPIPSASVPLTELLGLSALEVSAGVRSLCPILSRCKMYFYGSTAQPQSRKSSLSIFDKDFKGLAQGPRLVDPQTGDLYNAKGLFAQNSFTYADALTDLIPKAAAYSTGMINYFFRGEMRIDPSDYGVYAVADHYAERVADRDGFREVALKLTNVTGIAQAGIPSSSTTGFPETMDGTFRAVARFRRNTCYTPDLSGQIGMPGLGASCRSGVDEITVSDGVIGIVRPGEQKQFNFLFTLPIPIEATDLVLQVVFNGTLGAEPNAVAVTTKDVSEPSFFGYANMYDYQICLRSSRNPDYCNPGPWPVETLPSELSIRATEPLPLPVVPGASYPAYAGTTRNFPSLEWLSFSRSFPAPISYKVARMPIGGIKPGQYTRLALIGDVQAPVGFWPPYYTPGVKFSSPSFLSDFRGGVVDGYSDTPIYEEGVRLEANDLPFPYPVSCIKGRPTEASIIKLRFGRMRLTQVQADASGDLDASKLPKYYRLRGATLGVRVDRPDNLGEFGFMAAYTNDYGRTVSSSNLKEVENPYGFDHTALDRFSDDIAAPLGNAPALMLVPFESVEFRRIATVPSKEVVNGCNALLYRHGSPTRQYHIWKASQRAIYFRIQEWDQ
jgi:hypothetical protein